MVMGLFISIFFAQQLSRPIRLLNRVTQYTAAGRLHWMPLYRQRPSKAAPMMRRGRQAPRKQCYPTKVW